ncbi:Pentatricopeptide repeat-containing protein, partial [Durusdinium trenchii]
MDAYSLILLERLADRFTVKARVGFYCLLNYNGGAFSFVRREYAGRIKVILNTWSIVQKSDIAQTAMEEMPEEGEGEEGEGNEVKEDLKESTPVKGGKGGPGSAGSAGSQEMSPQSMDSADVVPIGKEMKVPTTFNEMLLFNASVMGYGSSTWMNIVLQQFDDMVKNVANFGRLQEECDVMSLVLAKYKGKINLPEFKAVTLASLRSLLPAEWDSEHEVAWAWLWENIEGLLSAMLGKPKLQEEALEQYFARIPDTVDWQTLRSQLFPSFLEATPTAQGYLKQSATRINFVAEKIILHSLEIYRAPRKMVEEISAVGLRHVGYGIPTEIFPPFVTCSVDLLKSLTQDELTIEAFRWSLSLMSKIMMRTISEGSTLVMKAINANQKFQLKRAMEVCARGQRAKELLNITAGSQSISPFYWAIDSGALMCAEVMLEDLLTIRADRDVYYYGVDALFTTHTECVQKICARAPTLMPTLLDGLVWRSRQTKEGMRRVNYYVKHLIQDLDGYFSSNLEWLVEHSDPKMVRHPTVILFSDVLWHRLASYKFILSKIYFLLILGVFIVGQAALLNHRLEETQTVAEDAVMFGCRIFNYIFSMCKLIISQANKTYRDLGNGNVR